MSPWALQAVTLCAGVWSGTRQVLGWSDRDDLIVPSDYLPAGHCPKVTGDSLETGSVAVLMSV